MPAILVASPFLIPHYFLLLGFLLQKLIADFSFWGVLKELTFGLFSFKASRSHLFRLDFWLFFPLSFFPSELILSCQVESFLATFLHDSSFSVPRGTSPLFMHCWFPSLLIFFFFCFIRWLIGTYLFSFLVFLGTPLKCINPTLALLHNPRIPSSWQPQASRPNSYH